MTSLKRTRIEELKIKAALLLKNLHSTDSQKREDAAKRLLALPFLRHSGIPGILKDTSFFRLKHSLQVIARENGQATWTALRTKIIMDDCLFHNATPSILNLWFNNYEQAREYQSEQGGYLVNYRKDYVVCQKEYIDSIGLGDMEQEWRAIGYDWVRPINKQAWDKLFNKAKQNYLSAKPTYKPIDKSKRPAWITGNVAE